MISTAFGRLSTGIKMLLILTAALLPLGLIAVFASIESAQSSRLRRTDDARQMASTAARQLSVGIGRASLALREATARLDYAPMPIVELRARCDVAVRDLVAAQRVPMAFAIYLADGHRVCASSGFSAAPAQHPTQTYATELRLLTADRRLRFESRSPGGMLFGIGEVPADGLRRMVQVEGAPIRHGIALSQGGDRLTLSTFGGLLPMENLLVVAAPVAQGQIMLTLRAVALRITAVEILLALLPILMWLAAALIGWFVVDRLVIRPLLQLQRAVASYRPELGPMMVPTLATPAQEIRNLGAAFAEVTARIHRHDSELAEGLVRQTKLTREVHHRVKNNLQVVASLINIHARGVDDPAVAGAYASIQRRVDALSVVHRNHFAELEANRGVGLRALIGELAANLRATADPGSRALAIGLDIVPAYVNQDVAVSVAFLITEIVEVAMQCEPRSAVTIRLVPTEEPLRARLSVTAPGLADDVACPVAVSDRFRRVVEGLSRQLRSKLSIDERTGEYAITIVVAALDFDAED